MKLNPCIEKLADMYAQDNGRFCSSCNTIVVDLTEKSTKQINQLYRENNGKLCGIVKPNQLVENKHYHPLKKFALALLLVFGSTLFVISCDTSFDFNTFQNEAYIQLHSSESNSVIKGFVYNNGVAVSIAEVMFRDGDIIYTAKTDSFGAFELHLPELTSNSIEIVIKAYGFAEVKKTVYLNGAQVFAGKINLEKQITGCTKGEIVPSSMGKVVPSNNPSIHKTGIVLESPVESGGIGPAINDSEFD